MLLPATVLEYLFTAAGKDKGPISVRGKLEGNDFIQTLVKYSGQRRLYLNRPMRKAAGIDVGDVASVKIEYNPEPTISEMPPALLSAFSKNKRAKDAFYKLVPSRRKEIMRYINSLKTENTIRNNIDKVILHLSGQARFAGRD